MKILSTLILLLLSVTAYSQSDSTRVFDLSKPDSIQLTNSIRTFDLSGGKVYKESSHNSLTEMIELMTFWSDTLNFASNQWIDKSGSNHLDLIQSNCYSDSVSNRSIALLADYQKLDTFLVSWEGYLYNTDQNGAMFLHHYYNSSNRLYLKVNTTDFTIALGGSATNNVTGIKYYLNTRYRISVYCRGSGGSGTCTITAKFDGHDEQTYSKTYTSLQFQGANTYIFGGVSPCQRGKAWNLNIDGRLYPLAEGAGYKVYDVSGQGKHLYLVVNYLWAKQNYFHYNLRYGYQLYQYPNAADIRVPYSINNDTAIIKGVVNTTDAYVFCGLFPALKNAHNRAETQLKQNNSVYGSFWSGNKSSTDFNSNTGNYVFANISDSIYLANIISFDNVISGSDLAMINDSTNKQTLDIWLLIGQSNSAGQAKLIDSVDSDIWRVRYNKYIASKTKVEPINPTTYNCYYPRTTQTYFGLENSFVNKIEVEENHIPTFIKYAFGGTSLHENANSSWHPDLDGDFYDKFVWHTDTILNYISGKYNYELKGFIWFQGETDAATEEYAEDYQANEALLVQAIRDKYGNLPFYSCKISETNIELPYASVVNDAKEANALAIDNYNLITTDDLYWKEDNTHLSTKGIIDLGERIADLINGL